MSSNDLANLWYYLLSGFFLLYIVFDGFDLGIGILALVNRDERFFKAGAEILHGVWHANQTWIIVFAAGLLGAFPAVYAVVTAALYIPLGLMLLGLMARGVTLEFNYLFPGNPRRVMLIYGLGSLVATVAQGLSVGALLSGLPMVNNQFAGGMWYWAAPLPIILGLGLPVFYGLLGATRMIGQTEGEVQAISRRASKRAALLSVAATAIFLAWCFIVRPGWTQSWFSWPGAMGTLLPLVIGALVFVPLWVSISGTGERAPFRWTALLIGLVFLGLANSLFPNIVPPNLSVTQAASDPVVMMVMLVGFGIAMPLILIYIIFMYRIFGGKVRLDQQQTEDHVATKRASR